MALVQEFTNRIPLMDGAERLVSTAKRMGMRTAICSGGFTLMGNKLQELIGIDYVFANELEAKDGRLTGQVSGEIVDGTRKALLMTQLADKLGVGLGEVIAIGDGANDLPMIEAAGLGVAFRAKPIVRERARHSISALGLDAVLYMMGLSDLDIDQLASQGMQSS